MTLEKIVRIRVKVATGARREKFERKGENAFEIAVKEEAERGLANERVCLLVARHFGVPAKAVRVINGQRRSSKTLAVVK